MLFAFGDCIVDTDKIELRRGGEPVRVEPKVFDILLHLIEHRDRVVSRDELIEQVWRGRIVSDASLSSGIRDARSAIGDDGQRQAMIKTLHRRGFRFIAETIPINDSAPKPGAILTQDIRMCLSKDRTPIAYAATGEGPPLLKSGNWMSHLEYELESPIWRHWVEGLSRHHRLIRYDQRGNGLSERNPKDVSYKVMVEDLEAVADAAEITDFVLFGVSFGAAIAIEYAVRHPERVRALVLYGGFPMGWRAYNDPRLSETYEAVNTLIKIGWGQNNPAFRQMFTMLFAPEATTEQVDWFNALQRETVSPEVAFRLQDAVGDLDITKRLPEVRVPTLVAHALRDEIAPIIAGQALAGLIPGARFVTLDSANHILLENEPAFEKLMQEVARFLESTEKADA